MTLNERRYRFQQKIVNDGLTYKMADWAGWDYSILNDIVTLRRKSKWDKRTLNDIFIMGDTETSKKHENAKAEIKQSKKKAEATGEEFIEKYIPVTNHVVVWTISIRAYGFNLVTLYGRKPSDMARCLSRIVDNLPGDDVLVYFHNLAYDWVFLRKFMFKEFGFPEKQLNTKPHYPISIQFANGLNLRDSLILAQRGLEKWADDLNVDHKKAVGDWDYDLFRNQNTPLSADELHYAEFDTLAGVECLDATLKGLQKELISIPFTATGIPRDHVRKLAEANNWRPKFEKIALTYPQYVKAVLVYHGGFTHGNRHDIGRTIREIVECRDFASSYPFTLCAFRFPMGAFNPIEATKEQILEMADDYAFMFRLILIKPRLKDDNVSMPYLQFSKCQRTINAVQDNGRILCAAFAEIYITEYDLMTLDEQYDADHWIITECEMAMKDYLPRWFTDYVFQCFVDKTMLKADPKNPEAYDPILYAIAKSKINSIYGLCCQKSIRETLSEDYTTGEFKVGETNPEEDYSKYLARSTSVLPYQWGVWVTAIATRNLFKLGACAGEWYYSDTDSCYGSEWNMEALNAYNEECKQRLRDNGYGAVIRDGREYWLGVAEFEGDKDTYTEFRVLGAKRYCGRCKKDGKLHITVAGVPKSGAECLNDDISNFEAGMIFPGTKTKKKTHTYLFTDSITTDENGNEVGDSIDLTPCDYLADMVELKDWQRIFKDEIFIEAYGEEGNYKWR